MECCAWVKQPLVGRSTGSPTLKEAARETTLELGILEVEQLLFSPFWTFILNLFVCYGDTEAKLAYYLPEGPGKQTASWT
jgi:hypothetical protein